MPIERVACALRKYLVHRSSDSVLEVSTIDKDRPQLRRRPSIHNDKHRKKDPFRQNREPRATLNELKEAEAQGRPVPWDWQEQSHIAELPRLKRSLSR